MICLLYENKKKKIMYKLLLNLILNSLNLIILAMICLKFILKEFMIVRHQFLNTLKFILMIY